MARRLIAVVVVALAVAAGLSGGAPATTAWATIVPMEETTTGTAFSRARAFGGRNMDLDIVDPSRKPARFDTGPPRSPVPIRKGRVGASVDEGGRYPYQVVGTASAGQKGWFTVC